MKRLKVVQFVILREKLLLEMINSCYSRAGDCSYNAEDLANIAHVQAQKILDTWEQLEAGNRAKCRDHIDDA